MHEARAARRIWLLKVITDCTVMARRASNILDDKKMSERVRSLAKASLLKQVKAIHAAEKELRS